MRSAVLLGAGALLAMTGCAEPGDGDLTGAGGDVGEVSDALMNTTPKGARWIVRDDAGAVNAEDAVELVFDATHVYWLTSGRTATSTVIPSRIFRAPRSGDGARELVLELAGEAGRDLAIFGGRLYFATDQRIGAVDPDGTDAATLSADARVFVNGTIAVDASGVYWPRQASVIRRVPLTGGAATSLAQWNSMTDVALDDQYVYWIERGTTETNGRVRRVAKTGGTATTVVSAQRRPHRLGVTATHVIYSEGGFTGTDGTVWPARVRRKPRDGSGSVQTIRTLPAPPRDLEVTAGGVFFFEGGTVVRRISHSGGSSTYVSTHEAPGGVLGADTANVAWTTSTMFDRVGIRLVPGSDVTSSICPATADVIADGETPIGLGISGTWVYFTDGDAVRRVWRNGSSLVEDVSVTEETIGADNLTAKLGGVYWTQRADSDYLVAGRTPKGACTMGLGRSQALDLTADTTRGEVYVIESAGFVMRFFDDCVGDGSQELGVVAGSGAGITDAGAWLYVTYTTPGGDAQLARMPKTGGAPEVMMSMPGDGAGRVAVDATHAYYFTTGGRLLRVPLDGSGPGLVIRNDLPGAYDIALDGLYVYVTVQAAGEADVLRLTKESGAQLTRISRPGTAWEVDGDGSCLVVALTFDDAGGEVVKVND